MSPQNITDKLELIAALTSGEIEGWRQAVRDYRTPFEGEMAALACRENQLKKGGR